MTDFLDNISDLYVVGGWVRDKLQGLEPKDMDLASYWTPNQIKVMSRGYEGWKVKDINPRHMVVAIVSPKGEVWEHTTFRTETNMDGIEAECHPSNSIWEDLNRRDFTVNAIAVKYQDRGDLREKNLYYPPGALEDLKEKKVRFVESGMYGNARQRLEQSANRYFRAFRFLCKGYTYTPEMFDALEEFTPDVLAYGNIESFYLEWQKTGFCIQYLSQLNYFYFFKTHKLGISAPNPRSFEIPPLPNADPRVTLFFSLHCFLQDDYPYYSQIAKAFCQNFRFPNKVYRQILDLRQAIDCTEAWEWAVFQPREYSKEELMDYHAHAHAVKLLSSTTLPTQGEIAAEGHPPRLIKHIWKERIKEILNNE